MRTYCGTICLVLLTIWVTGCAASYTRDLTVLSRAEALQDLDYLEENIRAIHPEPFNRISEAGFRAHMRRIRASIADPTPRKDLSLCVAEVLALIGDAHTNHSPLRDYSVYLRSEGKQFPLLLNYASGKTRVRGFRGPGPHGRIARGDTVESINGRLVTDYLDQWTKYASGETDEKRKWGLADGFNLYFWAVEGQVDAFEIALRDAKGIRYTERLTAPPFKVGARAKKRSSTTQRGSRFRFYSDGQVCLFKVPSFMIERAQFKGVLDDLFSKMRDNRTSTLIVDVRGNQGGSSGRPKELLRRAADKPFQHGRKKWRYSRAYERAMLIHGYRIAGVPSWLLLDRWVRLHSVSPSFAPDFDTWTRDGEYYTSPGVPIEPRKDAWQGSLVVVTDHWTGSAAVGLAAMVKDNGLGLIVGKETGGRASEFTEVAPVFLPNSGLACQIASAHGLRPAAYDDGRGVLPDLALDPMLNDASLVERTREYLASKGR